MTLLRTEPEIGNHFVWNEKVCLTTNPTMPLIVIKSLWDTFSICHFTNPATLHVPKGGLDGIVQDSCVKHCNNNNFGIVCCLLS